MVRHAADLGGWAVFHDGYSRRSDPGWPDLVLLREGECLAVEMKARRGRVSAEQRRWISELGKVPGIEAMVVRGIEETEALCARLLARR